MLIGHICQLSRKIDQRNTHARGNMTAQDELGTRHSGGVRGVDRIMIAATIINDSKKANQKRLMILGTSSQKFDLSTSCNEGRSTSLDKFVLFFIKPSWWRPT